MRVWRMKTCCKRAQFSCRHARLACKVGKVDKAVDEAGDVGGPNDGNNALSAVAGEKQILGKHEVAFVCDDLFDCGDLNFSLQFCCSLLLWGFLAKHQRNKVFRATVHMLSHSAV